MWQTSPHRCQFDLERDCRSVMFKTLRCASAIEVLSHASSSRLQRPLTADPLEIFLQGMPGDEATPNPQRHGQQARANDDPSNVEPIQAANRCRVSRRAIVTQRREEGLQHVATYVRCSLASAPYLQYENHRQGAPCAIFTRLNVAYASTPSTCWRHLCGKAESVANGFRIPHQPPPAG
jgi:hypothetical protein